MVRLPILSAIDLLMGPLILFILWSIANYQKRKYRGTPIAKYYLPAFWVRILGATLTAMMYQYYYDGGDTFWYYNFAHRIRNLMFINPGAALEMIFSSPEEYSYAAKSYLSQLNRLPKSFMYSPNTAFVIKTAAFSNIFTFNSYIGTSFIMTYFAFLGCWKIFQVFYDLYPHLHKWLALATLFVPSIFFWGTGIMKDSLCMAGLGYLFFGAYHLFIKRKKIISSSIYIILGAWVIFIVKAYIVAAFAPALMVWIFLTYRAKIKQRIVRILIGPAFLGIGLIVTVIFAQKMVASLGFDSLEAGIERSAITYDYIKRVSERKGGTYYDLGAMEPTIQGAISFFPKAVNVALFRPYLWEMGKIINIPSGLESLLTLLLTIYIFFKVGIFKSFKYLIKNPEILFCFIFAILFAFIVGLSSSNFGALARYKIPALPFYFSGLILLFSYSKKLNKSSPKS